MNEDRIEGAATTLGGRVETNIGQVAGDKKMQSDGLVDQARGSAQNMFGGAQDVLRSALDQAPPDVRVGVERAMVAVRKNPVLATLALGAVGLIVRRILGGTARSNRNSAG
jgi:uncharacterized protein YjbJ (UPF0337 family)